MKRIIKPLVIFLLVLNLNLLAFGYYFFVAKPNQDLGNRQIKATCLSATLLPEFKNETVNPPSSRRINFPSASYIYLEAKFKECIK